MKHIVVLALLAAGIYYFGFRGSEVERLLKPVSPAPATVVQDAFVQPDYRVTPIDDRQYLVDGQYTVIYYHWSQCPGCQRLDGDLPRFLGLRKDVVVRRLALANNWSTEGALHDFGRNIGASPFILIFGPNGKLIAADEGTGRKGFNLLYEWLNDVYEKDWKARQKASG